MRKKLSILLGILLICVQSALAQTVDVSGKVTDAGGVPIVNASITEKGTKNGTTSDASGNFKLSVKRNASLEISSVGFQTIVVSAGSGAALTIQMKEADQSLSEVVVTATGIRREKKALGYAVTTVNPDVLVQKSEPDILKGLQGKVPGVDIRVGQGAPGAATRIQIRGVASIGLGTQPLIVVDGVPYSNIEIGAGSAFSGGGASGTSLSNLDPNDIESISILKGAAAASLYGSRASNGVVLVTTKSGTAKKGAKSFNVNYRAGFSFEKIANLPEYQNSYGAGANFRTQSSNGSWGAKFGRGVVYNGSGNVVRNSASGIDSIPAATWAAMYAAYPELFPNGLIAYKAVPDNVSKLFKTGTLVENSVNFNGGEGNTSFNATLSNVTQKGYIENSSYGKNNISVGGQTKIGKLTLGANASYSRTKQVGGFFGQVQSFLTQWGRTFTMARNWDIAGWPITDRAGAQIGFNTGQYTNPIWAAHHNVITTTDDRVTANARASYKINNWIALNYQFGVNNYSLFRDAIVDESSYGSTDNALGNITETVYRNQEIQSTFVAAFTPKFGDNWTLDVKIGNDINERTSRYQQVYGVDFIVPNIFNLGNTNNKFFNSDSRTKRRLVGFFGDATIGYKNFAFINFAGRTDLTSTLPYANAQYFYPGVSGSLVWTDAFGIKSNWLNYGKVRVGYAKVGNDANPHNGQDIFGLSSTSFLGQPRAARGTTTYDPNLTPEFTSEIEAGTDFQLFKQRVNAEITWYDKRTTNLIYAVEVPVTTGYSSFYTNIGEIRNTGWEIGLAVKPVLTKDFEWEVRAAYTNNKNTVEKLVDGLDRIYYSGYEDAGGYLEPGMPFNYFRGDALARTEDGQLIIDPTNGWPYVDPNFTYLGNPNPKYKLGLTNNFSYKGFTLSVLFDMTVGGNFYSESINSMLGRGVTRDTEDREMSRVIGGVYGNTTPVVGSDGLLHYTPLLINGKPVPNQTKITTNDLYFQAGYANVSSFATNSAGEFSIYDATVYRLREISLGYDLPKKLVNRLKLTGVNLSVSGRNLWYLAPGTPKYINYDPEVSSFGTSAAQGFDITGAPSSKRFGINLNVTF